MPIKALSNGFPLNSTVPGHLFQTKSRNKSSPDLFSTICITDTLTHRVDKTSEIHKQFQTPTEHGCLVLLARIGQKQSDPPQIAVLFLRCVSSFLLLIIHYCFSARIIVINGRFLKRRPFRFASPCSQTHSFDVGAGRRFVSFLLELLLEESICYWS